MRKQEKQENNEEVRKLTPEERKKVEELGFEFYKKLKELEKKYTGDEFDNKKYKLFEENKKEIVELTSEDINIYQAISVFLDGYMEAPEKIMKEIKKEAKEYGQAALEELKKFSKEEKTREEIIKLECSFIYETSDFLSKKYNLYITFEDAKNLIFEGMGDSSKAQQIKLDADVMSLDELKESLYKMGIECAELFDKLKQKYPDENNPEQEAAFKKGEDELNECVDIVCDVYEYELGKKEIKNIIRKAGKDYFDERR